MLKSCVALMIAVGCLVASAAEPGGGSVFNGKDLAGLTACAKDQANNWKAVSSVKLAADPAKLSGEGAGGAADAVLLNTQPGSDLITDQKYGDCEVHAEFMVPKKGDSGLFLMGLYQLQVSDSFGLSDDKMSEGECGGILWTSKPKSNACLAPGEWQKLDITFQAPKFDAAGKKTTKAKFVKVTLNGKVVQENVEVEEPTGGGLEAPESPTGPLLIQGIEGAVAYRNIRVNSRP